MAVTGCTEILDGSVGPRSEGGIFEEYAQLPSQKEPFGHLDSARSCRTHLKPATAIKISRQAGYLEVNLKGFTTIQTDARMLVPICSRDLDENLDCQAL